MSFHRVLFFIVCISWCQFFNEGSQTEFQHGAKNVTVGEIDEGDKERKRELESFNNHEEEISRAELKIRSLLNCFLPVVASFFTIGVILKIYACCKGTRKPMFRRNRENQTSPPPLPTNDNLINSSSYPADERTNPLLSSVSDQVQYSPPVTFAGLHPTASPLLHVPQNDYHNHHQNQSDNPPPYNEACDNKKYPNFAG